MEMTYAKELLLLATWDHGDHAMTFPEPGCLPENFPVLFIDTLVVHEMDV